MMSRNRRIALLWLLTALAMAGMFLLVPAIPQDPAYHALADGRKFMGIPNFGNVASNLAFVVVGIAGFGALWRGWFGVPPIGEGDPLPFAYFFIGVAMVGPGSAWYHLNPNNATLFWDRLPMTVAFMALVAAVLSDRISKQWVACRGLNLLMAVGAASVVWWDISEGRGVGDLRAYALVQFWPVALVPMILWLFPAGRHVRAGYLLAAVAFYALAKAAEHYDHGFFALAAGMISGHTLKHLLAALAPAAIIAMMRKWPDADAAESQVEALAD
jgi:hypothetical protein